MDKNIIFEQAKRQIEDVYPILGFDMGCRFLYTPIDTLSPLTKLMFIGINPGGSNYDILFDMSNEEGNAYCVERWEGNRYNELQGEVITLFERLARKLEAEVAPRELMDKTLTSNFCPFREPRWSKLPVRRKRQVAEFSRDLWTSVCAQLNPSVIICLGKVTSDMSTADHFCQIFDEGQGFRTTSKPTGWGEYKYTIAELVSETRELTILDLPHLAQFKIMTRRNCDNHTNKFINIVAEKLNRSGWPTKE